MNKFRTGLTAAVAALALVAGGILATSMASATPTEETTLPADGVSSLTKAGDTWTLVSTGTPSEVKVMTPDLGVLCGVNYSTLPMDNPDHRPGCTTVVVFQSTADCVYVQVDGIPGQNSSDPYVCAPKSTPSMPPSTGTPSSPPPTTAPPAPTETPVPTTTPPTPPASSEPSPLSTMPPTNVPTSSPTATPTTAAHIPVTSSTPLPIAAESGSSALWQSSSQPSSLANTGAPVWSWLALVIVFFVVVLIGFLLLAIVRGPRRRNR